MEGKEILAVVDSVSSEKGLEKNVIFVAMELAIASASQRHFHEDAQILVAIDTSSGVYTTSRSWIVANEDDPDFHIESHKSPEESNLSIGEAFTQEVKNIEFGRIEAQAARQVMMQKVREAERENIVSKFRHQNNTLINGVVKRVTRDNVIVEINTDIEAILPSCLLYTSPSPRDRTRSRMPSSA